MNTKTETIRKKLQKAGVGHFIDVYIILFDSFAERYRAINSSGADPKQVLGMSLDFIYEAILGIDDPDKLKSFIHNVATRLSNFVGDEMAFTSYGRSLSGDDKRFLKKVENEGQSPYNAEYIAGMERIIVARDELNGTKRRNNVSTYEHCKRVRKLSEKLCKALGLSDQETAQIKESADLHDLGITFMPKEIYEPRELTRDEFEMVKKHPLIGRFILRKEDDGYLADGAGFHHEDWDGNGYPYKKTGEKIPLVGRVIRVADTYDGMTCGRPWREKKTPEQALEEIAEGAGKEFDPGIARSKILEYLLAA